MKSISFAPRAWNSFFSSFTEEMENNKMEHNIGTDDKARPFSISLLRERERERVTSVYL